MGRGTKGAVTPRMPAPADKFSNGAYVKTRAYEFDYPGDQRRWSRRDFAEHYFRSNALHCTATARVLIPAECSAVS